MENKNFGIILGFGHMGHLHMSHLNALGVRTAAWDGERECLDFFSSDFLKRTAPSKPFALIATPASSHFEYVKRALDARLDVFVEKPLCTSNEQAQTLIQLARDRKKLLFVGHCENFNPAFLRFKKEFLAMQENARLQALVFTRHHPFSVRGRDVSEIWDIGIHDFGLFQELKKSATQIVWDSVAVQFDENRESFKTERSIRAEFLSEEGQPFVLKVDLECWRRQEDSLLQDPLFAEEREFLRLRTLPWEIQRQQVLPNWETALFAVQMAESYTGMPKSPK